MASSGPLSISRESSEQSVEHKAESKEQNQKESQDSLGGSGFLLSILCSLAFDLVASQSFWSSESGGT